MVRPTKPTRNQIEQVVKDPRHIKAYEGLYENIDEINDALEIITTTPAVPITRTANVDYVDFNHHVKVAPNVGRVYWNYDDDTLNLHHSGDVVQQVGEELYMRAMNTTGSQIDNGSVASFAGVSGDIILIQKFIADGTIDSLYPIGITTQDIANNGTGRITVWGRVRDINTTGTPVSETWNVGDILYCNPNTAGALTKVKPTAPDLAIPIAAVLVKSATIGQIFVRPTIDQQLFYGAFSKTSDQTPAVINTAYAITFDNEETAQGVSIGTPTSRIVVTAAGLYEFSASYQLSSGSASVKNVWLWFRKNGTDIANTAFKVSLESGSALSTPSRSLFVSLAASDYIELYWAADDTNVTLDAIASTAFAPAAPACYLTVTQVQQ